MKNGQVQRSYEYVIPDGTRTGELLAVRGLSTLEESSRVYDTAALAVLFIRNRSWQEKYGVRPYKDQSQTRKHILKHLKRPGNYQFASILAEESADDPRYEAYSGYSEHRPVYSLLGKVASKLTSGFEPLTTGHVRFDPKRAYIHNVAVRPQDQQQGIGEALTDAALRVYPPHVEVVLEATGERSYTHEWFERLGLEPNDNEDVDPLVIDGVELAQQRYGRASVQDVRAKLQVNPVQRF